MVKISYVCPIFNKQNYIKQVLSALKINKEVLKENLFLLMMVQQIPHWIT